MAHWDDVVSSSLALLALLAAADLLVFERQLRDKDPRDVCVVPAAGGAERCLTTDGTDDAWPRFFPDGERVLFSSNRSGSWDLWETAVQGGVARQVLPGRAREWQADVSDDGRRLAYLSDASGSDALALLERASGAVRELVRHARRSVMGNPDLSPDGRRIAFSSNVRFGHQIYVWAEGAQEPRRISPLVRGGCSPRFTPDGKKVLYVSRRHLKTTSWIVEQDLATGEERILVQWPALNYDPVLSPDGGELAFASTITGTFQVYRLRLSDGRSWRVTQGPGAARMPDYQPPANRAPGGPRG